MWVSIGSLACLAGPFIFVPSLFSCGSASLPAIKIKIVSPGGWRDTPGAFWNKGPVIVAFYRVLWAHAIRIITSLIFRSGHLKGLGRSIPFFLPEENGIKLPRMTYAPVKAVYLRAKAVIFHRNHGDSDCCHEGRRWPYVCQQLSKYFFYHIFPSRSLPAFLTQNYRKKRMVGSVIPSLRGGRACKPVDWAADLCDEQTQRAFNSLRSCMDVCLKSSEWCLGNGREIKGCCSSCFCSSLPNKSDEI